MNILVVGTDEREQRIINLCAKSKLLHKIITASDNPLDNIANIEYDGLDDLCKKVKALQIDIAIIVNPALLKEGYADILRKNRINVIGMNQKWTNLENSRLIAKKLSEYYSINTPEIIKIPAIFPVVIKTDQPKSKKIAKTMQELVEIRESLDGEEVFLEEYLIGEEYSLVSLWDGKNITHFDLNYNLTEVQTDRLDLYKTKLSFMLSDENADFTGFVVSKLLWAKNDWYLLSYKTCPNSQELDNIFAGLKKDFLYILNSAIYQKLNEI